MALILVVDDDPDIRFVARLALKRGKHEVTVADSGRAALAHLDSGAACDLILCDRMMPEMSGVETLAEVRRRRAEVNPKTLTLAEFDRKLRRFGI